MSVADCYAPAVPTARYLALSARPCILRVCIRMYLLRERIRERERISEIRARVRVSTVRLRGS